MPDNETSVTIRRERDVCIVELPDTFTSDVVAPFNEQVEWALADTPGGVVVDFSRVKSADAGGAAALEFLAQRSEEVDIPVMLAGVNDAVRPVLAATGFLKTMEVVSSVDEAIEKLNS